MVLTQSEFPMNETFTVSIVVPNWNGRELLQKHLSRVIAATGETTEIIVVDDASTDGSLELVAEKFPSIALIRKPTHEGFTSTVNVGVQASRGDIVVLLNTDVEPERGFIKPLVAHFSDPSVFAVGCMDKSIEGDRVVLRGRGEAFWKNGFYVHRRGEVDKTDTAWVSGGSGAFRKKIWESLGGMDPLFNPFYWEDIDLSYRALKAGYRLRFEPKSVVRHYHEEGKIQQTFSLQEVRTIAFRNQFIFIWRNLSDFGLWWEHSLWSPVRIVQSLLRGDPAMMYGYVAALKLLPQIIISRHKVSPTWVRKDLEVAPHE